jgi:hypothetical protein
MNPLIYEKITNPILDDTQDFLLLIEFQQLPSGKPGGFFIKIEKRSKGDN